MQISRPFEYTKRNGAPTVTLLLSEAMLKAFLRSLRARGMTRSVLFRNVLEEYSAVVCRKAPASLVPRTRYQHQGQRLQRVNMKMDWEVWARLQALARGLGVSCCLLAVWLLELHLDASGRGRIVSEPNRSVRTHCFFSMDMIRPRFRRRITLRKYVTDLRWERSLRMVRESQRRWALGLAPDFSLEEKPLGR